MGNFGTRVCQVLVFAVTLGAPGLLIAEEEDSERHAVRLEPVVVSATRTGLSTEAPAASVTVLDANDIAESANVAVDDVLRTIPGFSLFRRSSSIVTSPNLDPEAQGVTLRGIGPSGVSRALVLVDGVPLTDPFNGQVYWGKLSTENIERIEVVRGAMANLWGNYAMAGVINIVTRQPTDQSAAVKVSYGTDKLTEDNAFVSARLGNFFINLEGNYFDTSGYPIVAPEERGPIDGNGSSRHEIFNGRLGFDANDRTRLMVHGQFFDEERDNGTPLRDSHTQSGLIDASATTRTDDDSEWQVRGFSNLQTFSLHNSMVAGEGEGEEEAERIVRRRGKAAGEDDGGNDERDEEHRSQTQKIPSRDLGGALVWSKQVLAPLIVTAGLDLHWIQGESRDNFFDEEGVDVETRQRSSGQQFFSGIFAQGIWEPTRRWQITLGGRVDVWRNYSGSLRMEHDDGTLDARTFDSDAQATFNPKLSVLYRAFDWMHVRGAAYRAFRAPTLAELYRPSAVEGLSLLPNPNLDAERLWGAEVGFDLPITNRLDLRTTGYWSQIEDAIGDVDLPCDPGDVACDPDGEPTQRMRQNLGLARTVGVEAEGIYEILPGLTAGISYLYSDATLVRNPAERDLEGKDLAQIPHNTFTVRGRYSNPKLFTFAMEGRFVDVQFEDADNNERMGSYFIVNASLSRRLPFWGGEIFIAAENLFDHGYTVDLGGGVRKIGSPLIGHGGIRFRL